MAVASVEAHSRAAHLRRCAGRAPGGGWSGPRLERRQVMHVPPPLTMGEQASTIGAEAPRLHVGSEVGRLRRVILHRPDLELRRLTPSNKDELLFDDVLWVRRARAEHDGFADALRDRGIEVHLFGDLLREALELPKARDLVLGRVFDENE